MQQVVGLHITKQSVEAMPVDNTVTRSRSTCDGLLVAPGEAAAVGARGGARGARGGGGGGGARVAEGGARAPHRPTLQRRVRRAAAPACAETPAESLRRAGADWLVGSLVHTYILITYINYIFIRY